MTENKNQNQNQEEVNKALKIMEKDIADVIFNRVNQMEQSQQLMFPANYAVGNALKSAYLVIQNTKTSKSSGEKPVLEACTKESIANALLDMVIQGLTPAKKQCYFIPYGNQLEMSRSYFGDQAAVMTALNLDKKPYATCIYKDDIIEIGYRDDDGEKIVVKHETTFENINKSIIGAYAILYTNDGVKHYEIMTWDQIQKSWSKSKMGINSTHKDYPEEMSRRTVLRRIAKHWMNTSDDSNLFIVESYNRTTENEYINDEPTNNAELQLEVDNTANSQPLTIEGETVEQPQAPIEQPTTPGPGF